LGEMGQNHKTADQYHHRAEPRAVAFTAGLVTVDFISTILRRLRVVIAL